VSGVSFGFYDLLDLRKRVKIGPELFQGKSTAADLEDINSTTQKLVKQVLDDTVSKAGQLDGSKDYTCAAMALSGARGLNTDAADCWFAWLPESGRHWVLGS